MGGPTFSFFLSLRALEALLRSRTYRRILINRDVNLYLDASVEELQAALGDRIEESFIGNFLLKQFDKGQGSLANEFISDILADESRFCAFPYSVFILDVKPSEAKRIREQYGVLCYSDSLIPRLPHLRYKKSAFCKKEEVHHSWSAIFNGLSGFPISTILINDRYILPSLTDFDLQNAEYNIGEIISALSPSAKHTANLTVFLYFDAVDNNWVDKTFKLSAPFTQNKDDMNRLNDSFHSSVEEEFEQKSKEIVDIVKASVNGNYPVRVICASYFRGLRRRKDMISMETYVDGYDYTHNRRIMTDYQFVSAEHGLLAFTANGRSQIEQSIGIKSLYAEGLKDVSDIPEDRHRHELNRFAGLAEKSHIKNLLLSVDGGLVEQDRKLAVLHSIPLLQDAYPDSGTYTFKKRKMTSEL